MCFNPIHRFEIWSKPTEKEEWTENLMNFRYLQKKTTARPTWFTARWRKNNLFCSMNILSTNSYFVFHSMLLLQFDCLCVPFSCSGFFLFLSLSLYFPMVLFIFSIVWFSLQRILDTASGHNAVQCTIDYTLFSASCLG